MQRIFSTFPNSWPGLGLLLLRLATGLYLLKDAVQLPIDTVPDWTLHGIGLVSGILLIIGLWTPAAALANSVLLIYQALAVGGIDPDQVMRIVVGMAVAMLGPGSFSIDSRLFGRKRIDIPLPGRDQNS